MAAWLSTSRRKPPPGADPGGGEPDMFGGEVIKLCKQLRELCKPSNAVAQTGQPIGKLSISLRKTSQ
jgi:hypothetical protein